MWMSVGLHVKVDGKYWTLPALSLQAFLPHESFGVVKGRARSADKRSLVCSAALVPSTMLRLRAEGRMMDNGRLIAGDEPKVRLPSPLPALPASDDCFCRSFFCDSVPSDLQGSRAGSQPRSKSKP